MGESEFGVAQVCLDGHLISGAVDDSPEYSKNFCDKCGAATISKCQNCDVDIQGYASAISASYYQNFKPPAFCYNCGKPFPWTEASLQAARDLVEESGFSEEDQKTLEENIDDLVKESPRTVLAATRFKKIVSQMGKGTLRAFRTILIDIVSETAKKIIWPQE